MKQLFLASVLTLIITQIFAQRVTIMNYDQLEQRFKDKTDTLYVINYWATWCKPCVEELPYFLKVNNENKNRKFKLVLVTLDFSKHLESRVLPFLAKNNITAEVILLDDDNANYWINQVNKDWDGSIPVTQFKYKNKTKFYGSSLTYEELSKIISTFSY